MQFITFLWRLLLFSLVFLLVGQLFGTCVFPESGGYATRMVCIKGEWKRKISILIHVFTDSVEIGVKDQIHNPEEKRENLITDFGE